jgi:hypothetical protein
MVMGDKVPAATDRPASSKHEAAQLLQEMNRLLQSSGLMVPAPPKGEAGTKRPAAGPGLTVVTYRVDEPVGEYMGALANQAGLPRQR